MPMCVICRKFVAKWDPDFSKNLHLVKGRYYCTDHVPKEKEQKDVWE
jgi:hypothetical protein